MSNKRIRKKKEARFTKKIIDFVGEVPPGCASVIIQEDGAFTRHGDLCSLNRFTGTGRLINTRCMGARGRSPKGKIFVVWKNGKPEVNVKEYKGEALFPNFQQIPN